jgi:NAD(P)-dependent dehydrogenase (short-subunit alcohol dehydrogenase family)
MQDVMSLEGKTIVVTGAAQGIGQAIAGLAIDLGARVIGVDLNGDKLDAFAAMTNGKLLPYVGSVADPEFTETTVRDVKARVAIDGPRNARIDVEDVYHVVATIGSSAVPCIATKERTSPQDVPSTTVAFSLGF